MGRVMKGMALFMHAKEQLTRLARKQPAKPPLRNSLSLRKTLLYFVQEIQIFLLLLFYLTCHFCQTHSPEGLGKLMNIIGQTFQLTRHLLLIVHHFR